MIQSFRNKQHRLVAGVMSGTSLDGIDVAFVRISGTGDHMVHELVGFHSIPYEEEVKERLFTACSGEYSIREAFELDADLGMLYAVAIRDAAQECAIRLDALDAVGVHGQTVYHNPWRSPNGVTVQLGSGAVIANKLNVLTVNDFRSADVAAGGEGAPLVPYCDYALLHSSKQNRVSLNIGGIANITWLPQDATPERLIAFDTGPGNVLIDAAMRALFGKEYDAGGGVAAQGKAHEEWLEELMMDPYYKMEPPKSSGRERFSEEMGKGMVETGKEQGLGDEDVVATITGLTARSIARAIEEYASKGETVDEIIVGGGGARNGTLMEMIGKEMPGSRVTTSDEYSIPSDAKEALCFAILTNEALCGTPANVPSVTGASGPVICGTIHLPLPLSRREEYDA